MNQGLATKAALFLAGVVFGVAADDHVCNFDAAAITEKAKYWPEVHVAGKVVEVAVDAKRFDFIKNVVYNDKGVGRARHCIHWHGKTTFVRREEAKDLSAWQGKPVLARVVAANAKEAARMAAGEPFSAKIATLLPKRSDAAIATVEADERIVRMTADDARSGTIELDGKSVKMRLARRGTQIAVETPFAPAALAADFWKALVSGAEIDGRFVADRVVVSSRPDPRAGDDPQLPRVLVIGDSISMNYHEAAKTALAGVANYHRNEGNSFSSFYGMQYVDFWLGNHQQPGFQWDVIQFNHGLHDLKQTGPDAPYATAIADYQANLHKLIQRLKQSGATLIWCTTTPVPNTRGGRYGRQKGAEVAFNAAALEVVRQYPEIRINDLCAAVNDSPVFDNFRKGSDVHYYKPDEQRVLGEAVATAVKQALIARK